VGADALGPCSARRVGSTARPVGDEEDDEDEPEFDFAGQEVAMAILLFSPAERASPSKSSPRDALETPRAAYDEDDEEAHEEIAEARAEWEEAYGDAQGCCSTSSRTARDHEDDDEISSPRSAWRRCASSSSRPGWRSRCCPQTAAGCPAPNCSRWPGAYRREFDAEVDGWTAARGADAARASCLSSPRGRAGRADARVAAVTRIGPRPTRWRASLAVPQVARYAKVALALLSGHRPEDTGPSTSPGSLR